MKKLILFTLIITFGLRSNAQSVSISMITAPCDSNGVLVATFTGAPPSYTVSWISELGLIATHSVTTATDTLYGYTGGYIEVAGGDSSYYTSTYTTINLPFIATASEINATCPALGTVTATVSGGTGPYTYSWISAGTHTIVATTNPANVPAGTYLLRVTDMGTGCVSGFSDSLIVSIYPDFTQIQTATPAICPASSGTATDSILTGGTPPFTYEWINVSTGLIVSTTSPATLPIGIYWERTTDALGCISYTWPDAIEVSSIPDFTQTVTTTPAICPALGSGIVSVTGGTTPFSYSWTNVTTGVVYSSSTSPVSLPCCYYVENTTDGLGCTVNGGSWSVGYVADFTATVTTTSADCTNGTASVAITGGTTPFSYLWSTGATTASISGLITGTYALTLTDALGCVDSALSGYVPQAVTITVNGLVTPATCIATNGAVTAFGSGGTPPYTYLWSDGATTQTISGLASGNYTVTTTDANGCLGWGGDYVTSSTPITVTYSTTPSSCTSPTGTATLIFSGGTGPYTILWYTIPTQATVTAVDLSPGNYYFTITDAMGCIQSGTVTVPPVDIINLSFTSTPATCAASDGSVIVSASGGVAPYTYSWNTGSTSATLSGVPYGTYYATVTDAHGCSVTNCQHVPYTSPLELGLSSTPASCLYTSNGTITATASLGTPPYHYSMGGSSSGSVTAPGLATGSYWISVYDAMGCTAAQYTYVDYNVHDSSCFCVVQGTVYDDLSLDCSPAGDPGIQNIQLQASGFGYTYSNDSGYYYFLLPSGTYTVSQTVLSMYPLSPCQVNNIPVTITAATGCYHTINFADTLTPIHDMAISTWDYTMPIPGFPYTQTTVITNNGTVTDSNILASYVPDGQLYSPTFVPSGIFTGAPYYYTTPGTFPLLNPGTSQEFLMTYNVPADIPLGTNVIFKDTVSYMPPMSNWLNDYSPWNNVDYFTTTTVGSYDPNFKEVSPKGTGADGMITTQDSVLQYMIHFQNIGSYMAQNVVIIDTLDPNLDWTTLRPVYMSDKCVVDMNDHGIITFTFSNIDLPPSSSEPITSNAMFTYTVKQRPALPYGTQIKNRASIYFDFNAPVMTNQTLNTIGWPTSTPNVPGPTANNSFTIFPNPAQNNFTAIINVGTGGTYNLKVIDVTGKTEITKTLSLLQGTQNITVDANTLAPGVYFVTLSGSDNLVRTQKLVIMK